jgi:hypothetical protein
MMMILSFYEEKREAGGTNPAGFREVSVRLSSGTPIPTCVR